jgi:hypothetical protein
VIPSILRSRVESQTVDHPILGPTRQHRLIVETSAGMPVFGAWRESRSGARTDKAKIARQIRSLAAFVA